ncbi:MAG: LamG domain-containing protein [Kosmotoga sp.]|nr:MAG: LamG domain-containing protein [Kosmotoga sp.]
MKKITSLIITASAIFLILVILAGCPSLMNKPPELEITGSDSGSSYVEINYTIIPENMPETEVVVKRSKNDVNYSNLCTLSYDATQLIDTNVIPETTYYYELQLLSNEKILDSAKTSVTTAEEEEDTYETDEFSGTVELPENVDPTTLVVRNMDKVSPLDSEGNFNIDVKDDQVSVLFCSVPEYKVPLMKMVSPMDEDMQMQLSEREINTLTTAKALLMLNPFLATPFPDSMEKVNEAIESCSYLSTLALLIERLNNGETEVEDELESTIESALDEIIEYLNVHYPAEEPSISDFEPLKMKLPLMEPQSTGVLEAIDLERAVLFLNVEEIDGKTYYELQPKIPGDWISVVSVLMLSEMSNGLTQEQIKAFEHDKSIGPYIAEFPDFGVVQSEPLYKWIDALGIVIDMGIDKVFDYFVGKETTTRFLIPAWEEGVYSFSSYGGFADFSEFEIFKEDLWYAIEEIKKGGIITSLELPYELSAFFSMTALNGLDLSLTIISTICDVKGLTDGKFISDVAKAIPEALKKGILAAEFELISDLQNINKWTKFMLVYVDTITQEGLRSLSKAGVKAVVGLIVKEIIKYVTVVSKIEAIISNASEAIARITSMAGYVSPRELAFVTVEEGNQSPEITKGDGPSGTIDENSFTFTWSGEDPDGEIDHYEYKKDGGSWVNYGKSESYTWSGYTEGSHTFEVRAQDNDGAYSDVISWSFVYDSSPIEGLIAYWGMNQGVQADKTLVDESGNNRDGTVKNEFDVVNGVLGKALYLYGEGYCTSSGGHVMLPYINFEVMNEFTISLWVKEDGLSHYHGEGYIFAGDTSYSDSGRLTIGHYTGDLCFSVGEGKEGTLRLSFKDEYISDYIYYCLVYKNGISKAYINGEKVGEIENEISIDGEKFALGRHWWYSTSTRFIGAIDEVRIYDKSLSESEIDKLYNLNY